MTQQKDDSLYPVQYINSYQGVQNINSLSGKLSGKLSVQSSANREQAEYLKHQFLNNSFSKQLSTNVDGLSQMSTQSVENFFINPYMVQASLEPGQYKTLNSAFEPGKALNLPTTLPLNNLQKMPSRKSEEVNYRTMNLEFARLRSGQTQASTGNVNDFVTNIALDMEENPFEDLSLHGIDAPNTLPDDKNIEEILRTADTAQNIQNFQEVEQSKDKQEKKSVNFKGILLQGSKMPQGKQQKSKQPQLPKFLKRLQSKQERSIEDSAREQEILQQQNQEKELQQVSQQSEENAQVVSNSTVAENQVQNLKRKKSQNQQGASNFSIGSLFQSQAKFSKSQSDQQIEQQQRQEGDTSNTQEQNLKQESGEIGPITCDQEQQGQDIQDQQQNKKYTKAFGFLDSRSRSNSKQLQSKGSQEQPKIGKTQEMQGKEKQVEDSNKEIAPSSQGQIAQEGRRQSAGLGIFRGFGASTNNNNEKIDRQTSDAIIGAPTGQIGLLNNGNTCFMNAAFQCLRCTPHLLQALLEELNMNNITQPQEDLIKPLQDEVEIQYEKIVHTLETAKSGPITVDSVTGSYQQDYLQNKIQSGCQFQEILNNSDQKIKAYNPLSGNPAKAIAKSISTLDGSSKLKTQSAFQRSSLFGNQQSFRRIKEDQSTRKDQNSIITSFGKHQLNGGDMKYYKPYNKQEQVFQMLQKAEDTQFLQYLEKQSSQVQDSEKSCIQSGDIVMQKQLCQDSQEVSQSQQDKTEQSFQQIVNSEFFGGPRLKRSWSNIQLKSTQQFSLLNKPPIRTESLQSQTQSIQSYGDQSINSSFQKGENQGKPNLLRQSTSIAKKKLFSQMSFGSQNNRFKNQSEQDNQQVNKSSLARPSQGLSRPSIFSFRKKDSFNDMRTNSNLQSQLGSNNFQHPLLNSLSGKQESRRMPFQYEQAKVERLCANPTIEIDNLFLEVDFSGFNRGGENIGRPINLQHAALNLPHDCLVDQSSQGMATATNINTMLDPKPYSYNPHQFNQNGMNTSAQQGGYQNLQRNSKISLPIKGKSTTQVSIELMQKLTEENPRNMVNLLDLQLELQKQDMGKELCDGGQHDSQEFLKILLNYIHSDLKQAKKGQDGAQIKTSQKDLKSLVRLQKQVKDQILNQQYSHGSSKQQIDQQTKTNPNQGANLQGLIGIGGKSDQAEESETTEEDKESVNDQQEAGGLTIDSCMELDTYSQMQQLVKEEAKENLQNTLRSQMQAQQISEDTDVSVDQQNENSIQSYPVQLSNLEASVETPNKQNQQFGIQAKLSVPQASAFSQAATQKRDSFTKANNELDTVKGDSNKEQKETESESKWKDYVKTEDTLVTDFFVGQLQSSVKCHTCGTKSNQYEVYQELILPIQREKKGIWNPLKPSITLDELMRVFTQEEEMKGKDAFYCEKCKQKQTATKQLLISRYSKEIYIVNKERKIKFYTPGFDKFPKILVVQLLRSRDRLNTQVNFPLRNLDLNQFSSNPANVSSDTEPLSTRANSKKLDQKNQDNAKLNQQQQDTQTNKQTNGQPSTFGKYDLYGVINHFGSMSQGHYTSFCKIKTLLDKEEWFLFNDGLVSKINPEKIVTQNAYMLFYVSRDFVNQNRQQKVEKEH